MARHELNRLGNIRDNVEWIADLWDRVQAAPTPAHAAEYLAEMASHAGALAREANFQATA